ncbi:MAG TPA: NAD(P)/FAD-dependent oxidoreductase [Terriglobales bacterium]|nr:NAD(P)/FAD-dependent oxidoreductase [Terriglobales bacterium]
MSFTPQVVIIGAGAAGMSAAIDLANAGLKVQILEARDRIGGRMFTKHDLEINAPIELGAEFIHGRSPELWQLLREKNVSISEVGGDNWCREDDELRHCDFFSEVDDILAKMDASGPDESFVDFLHRCFPDSDSEGPRRKKAKRRAISYVTGFNAADPAKVSAHWLVQEMQAEEKIEGERAFRSQRGYYDLIEIFRQKLIAAKIDIQLNTVIENVRWRDGEVEIFGNNGDGKITISTPKLLITVPAGVLQAASRERGAIQFIPELPLEKLSALAKIEMGKVIRVTLCFHERFWDSLHPSKARSETLSDMSFLFSQTGNEWIPTWWTTMPQKYPILVGWAPFRAAEKLSGQGEDFIKQKALETLSQLLPIDKQKLENLLKAIYVHDWQNDPFSRGAYSYVKVGGEDSPAALGESIENTLFFAGEATDIGGNTGTVHGAIASGKRAANEILSGSNSF